MTPPFGHLFEVVGQAVTVHRHPGQPRDKWGTLRQPESHSAAGCVFAPGASSETTDGQRDTVTTLSTLYCPPGSDITADDVVALPDGTQWDVAGDPQIWVDPFTGAAVGLQVALTRTKG